MPFEKSAVLLLALAASLAWLPAAQAESAHKQAKSAHKKAKVKALESAPSSEVPVNAGEKLDLKLDGGAGEGGVPTGKPKPGDPPKLPEGMQLPGRGGIDAAAEAKKAGTER